MATTAPADSTESDNANASDSTGSTSAAESPARKKAPYVYPIHPLQYRAVRMTSFLLEDSKHEIAPADFLREAISRHLDYYQTKRNIQFPPKMLEELTKLHLIG